MSPRRVGVLLGKEFLYGSRNFIFVFALVVPIVVSLIVSLLFGTLFSDKPNLGITDAGRSEIVRMAAEIDSVVVIKYDSPEELKAAAGAGAVDVGVILPAGFDDLVKRGESTTLNVLIWGESLLKHRTVLGSTVIVLIRELAGQEAPVEIVTTILGDGVHLPWADRLLPFIVMIAMLVGGVMMPATSLVEEKQKRTLGALITTPTSLGEVFLAKGLLGAILGMLMGVVTLALNRAFGEQQLLLLLVLGLGAVSAAAFGVLLGAFVKDINTLFALIKGLGIFLYAPAIVSMFPELPQWIAKVFPTYYIINPVIEISQQGGIWSDVSMEVLVTIGLILALVASVALIARRTRHQQV